ncbi:MAG: hypothetical protein NVSMB62_11410 [Acidobacteriaceae bacterium]
MIAYVALFSMTQDVVEAIDLDVIGDAVALALSTLDCRISLSIFPNSWCPMVLQ